MCFLHSKGIVYFYKVKKEPEIGVICSLTSTLCWAQVSILSTYLKNTGESSHDPKGKQVGSLMILSHVLKNLECKN